jgi:predicted amidohydrolase
MIVGPWGEILAHAGEQPGIITAELDFSEVEKARTAIPALQHDKEIDFPLPVGRGSG